MATLSQRMAQAAFPRVTANKRDMNEKKFKEYKTFAKKFPALIHTCGFAQAVAFAEAKQEDKFLGDLAAVVGAGHPEINNAAALANRSRSESLSGYLRLSRNALLAAGWLKRYVEAVSGEEE